MSQTPSTPQPAEQQQPAAKPPQPTPRLVKTWKFWSAVLVVAIIAALSYFFEDVKDQFPWLVTMQLFTYGELSHAQARESRPKWVVPVEIDNRTFFDAMHRKNPDDTTDRGFLATVVRRAVDANAAVVALDFNLVRGQTNAGSTDELNAQLWDAIRYAESRHVPVVLTFAFDLQAMRPLDNIYGADKVPLCQDSVGLYAPRAGFDHGPSDKRKVPLVVRARSQDGSSELLCRSFALQIVDAYEGVTGISPTSVERLNEVIGEHEFAYTTFIRQNKFLHPVSAADIFNGDPAVLARLDHRIVLIGGNHTHWPNEKPPDDMLDYHHSPEGDMAGMYFHANYVEGLLDDRIQSNVPRWLAVLIDVVLATAIIIAINKWDGTQRIVALVVLIGFPVIIAYTAMVALGYCFDFVLPVVLSFLHPAIDEYLNLPEHFRKVHAHA
jgi:CHASE2 domain-containing sensor protein